MVVLHTKSMKNFYVKISLAIVSVLTAMVVLFWGSTIALAAEEDEFDKEQAAVQQYEESFEVNVEFLESLDESEIVMVGQNSEVIACGYQVILNSKLQVRYYMKLSENIMNSENSGMEYVVDGECKYAKRTDYNDGLVFYTFELAPKYIASTIELSFNYNGISYHLENFSIRDYLEIIIKNKDNKVEYSAAKDISLAVLEYGACSQLYFNYNTDDLADKNYPLHNYNNVNEEEIVDTKTHLYGNEANEEFEFLGCALSLNAGTSINLYFSNELSKNEIDEKYDIYVLGAGDKTVEYRVLPHILMVALNDIPIAEIDDAFCFVIKNKNGNVLQMEFSCIKYFELVMEQSSDESLKNLCKTMYLYNKEANNYFDNYTLAPSSDTFKEKGIIGCDYYGQLFEADGNRKEINFYNYVGKLSFLYSNDNACIEQIDGNYYIKLKSYGVTDIRVTDENKNYCEFSVKAYSVDCSVTGYDMSDGTVNCKVGDTVKFDCKVTDPYGNNIDYELYSYNKNIEISQDGSVGMKSLGYASLGLKFVYEMGEFRKSISSLHISSKDGLYSENSIYAVSDIKTEEFISFENYTGTLSTVSDNDCVKIEFKDGVSGKGLYVTYLNPGVANVTVTDSANKSADIIIVAGCVEAYVNGEKVGADIYFKVGDTFDFSYITNDNTGLFYDFLLYGAGVEGISFSEDSGIHSMKCVDEGDVDFEICWAGIYKTYTIHIGK